MKEIIFKFFVFTFNVLVAIDNPEKNYYMVANPACVS